MIRTRRILPLLVGLCLLLGLSEATLAQSVSRASFKVITEVQELMEADRNAEAIAMLEELVLKTRDIPYDHAIANQYLAHNSVMMDNVPRARRALEAALAVPDLPQKMAAEMKLFYGSVLMGDEEFKLARQMLEEWLVIAERPTPSQYFTVGYANYMSGGLERAEELVSRAVANAGTKAKESWIQTYYRVLFERKKYRAAENLLYRLIARDPSKELHWRMLASHYLQLEMNNDALAAMMLSYMNEQIEKPSELKKIIALYSYIDVPEKAARLLESWIAQGRVEADVDTKKQLGGLWLVARERDKAKVALTEAAAAAPDGRTYAMLGGIYFEDEDWRAAHGAYRRALRLGGIDEPPRITLLAGISALRAGMKEEARSALREAANTPKYRKQARGLIKQLNKMGEVEKE